MIELREIKCAYFIGIGGIGMSAIARFLNVRNVAISGYDKVNTPLTKKLEEEGMKIHYEDNIEFIPENIDIVIYTPAIPDDHAELNHLYNRGDRIVKRAEFLGWISKQYATIAIAGTHGKTSTSALLGHLLIHGGVQSTAFVGGLMKNYNSNYFSTGSDWVVMEADEYDRSFLQLHPRHAVITSLDADHLDIYGSGNALKKTFGDFLRLLPADGHVYTFSYLEAELQSISESCKAELHFIGRNKAEVRIENVRAENGKMVFSYHNAETKMLDLSLAFPGEHNVMNAAAAIGIALEIGLKEEAIRKGLASFQGIKRRFELIYADEFIRYYDDYAHHPTEIEAFSSGIKQLHPDEEICAVFQPHLYSRTQDFSDGFAAALDRFDKVCLLPIYPAREQPIENVTSELIFQKMQRKEKWLIEKDDLENWISQQHSKVLVTIGAGDIGQMVTGIKKMLESKKRR